MNRRKARILALKILFQSEYRDIPDLRSLAALLDDQDQKGRKDSLGRIEFALKIVQGTERHREAIDQAIALAGERWTPDRMALIDLNIMRIAVFEMLFQPDIPGKTSVNEAVESAKIFGDKDSASFVNGVLDKVLRSSLSSSGLSSGKMKPGI